MLTAYTAYCAERETAQRRRILTDSVILPAGRVQRDGTMLVNFASNDYLGLSQHPALREAAQAAVAAYGTGVTASRLIAGNHPLHARIESRLAAGKRQPAAIVLSSGYLANLTVLAALADASVLGKPVTVLADRLAHHSLLQGAALAGAKLQRFRHNDTEHLAALLRRERGQNRATIIVTESVFGMDGDRADLLSISGLAQEYEALLYIDEAHATGVFGPDGFGLAADHAAPHVIAMGTFGKALGCAGAYIACNTIIRDYLIQRCGGLVYSTGLPPAVLGSIAAALDLLPILQAERQQLQTAASRLRHALCQQGWQCGASTTQIIPVIVGAETMALKLAAALREAGFWVPAIRPPTVPPHASRLRISLSAAHSAEDITALIAAMAALAPDYTGQAA